MLRIRYLGRTSFALESKDTSVLLNPGIWDGTPVVPDDFDVRIIVVTNHLDDALGNAAKIADNSKAWILGNATTIEKVRKQGGKPWLLHELAAETPYEIPGLKITPHPLKRGMPASQDKIENLGLYIEMGRMRISYLGDTTIRGPFGQLEAEILITPIGGDGVFPVKDAVSLCVDARPRLVIPMRWYEPEQLAKFVRYVDQFAPGSIPLPMDVGKVAEVTWAAGNEFRYQVS
ncbi:MAG: MBL fold metallo-hydrolase [Candidatus Thorarchaeota archaeon]